METIWFCIVAVMLAAYVLLDGFDLGAGAIHLVAARADSERRDILASIGPVWDGNEVWLLAAGGTLYFAFPGLYASAFSGFYLALMIVLWLLVLRGISIEFRNHVSHAMWAGFWDAVFCGASALLAVFFGAALGNVVRGVPIGVDGFFFVPLWTDLRTGPSPGIIDWYTLLAGVTALLALTVHGALWIAMKTYAELRGRAHAIARILFWPMCAAVLAISLASFGVQPELRASFAARPWMCIFPVIGASGLIGMRLCLNAKLDACAFFCSAAFLAGILCSAAAGLYPEVLPSIVNPARSLTVFNTAAPAYGLRIGLLWWIPAFALAIAYSTFVYRHFRGRVSATEAAPAAVDPVLRSRETAAR